MKIETYLGIDNCHNYNGTDISLYDGFFNPQFSGTLEETIEYLEKLKLFFTPSKNNFFSWEGNFCWEGNNGWHSQGRLAIDSIDNEISRIKYLI